MATIVSCVNLKGGVGKTAIAVNFAAYCGRKGHKTLLVDLDPQTNATFWCIDIDEWERHAKKHGTLANLLGVRKHTSAEGASKTVKDVIRKNVFQNVDLLPSHLDLFSVDLELAGSTAREIKLRRALAPVVPEYDVIVCDCPPNLTIPTQNAIALSSHYVVPISPDYLSGIGVGLLIQRLKELTEALEHDIVHAGIIISRVGRPAIHRTQTVAALRKTFKTLVFKGTINERVVVSRAAAQKRSVYDMDDREAAAEFEAMSQELLKRLGVQ